MVKALWLDSLPVSNVSVVAPAGFLYLSVARSHPISFPRRIEWIRYILSGIYTTVECRTHVVIYLVQDQLSLY